MASDIRVVSATGSVLVKLTFNVPLNRMPGLMEKLHARSRLLDYCDRSRHFEKLRADL
ncbi:hypothetical protein [Chroococcidiopsis sp.]|uniref:hypothetical protein n=1 Tax=Chroococcidiopsis sp. TaxID=3088168 RepID=UPI003F350B67